MEQEPERVTEQESGPQYQCVPEQKSEHISLSFSEQVALSQPRISK